VFIFSAAVYARVSLNRFPDPKMRQDAIFLAATASKGLKNKKKCGFLIKFIIRAMHVFFGMAD
jgi:hypothetical protein